jgi:hypothetical protein
MCAPASSALSPAPSARVSCDCGLRGSTDTRLGRDLIPIQEPNSVHAAEPVVEGEKWICTKWLKLS